MNYWGKMMFKWVYWNLLLSGQDMPLEPVADSATGKASSFDEENFAKMLQDSDPKTLQKIKDLFAAD